MNEIEAARAEQQTRGLKAAALRARDACRAAYEFSANSYTFDALLEVEKLLRGHPMSRKRNKIEGQFVARTSEMLQSPAFRVLSLSAHRMLARIEIEHCSHGGNDNGRLPVTYDQFVEYGIHRDSIPPASRELEAVGLMEVTERGSAGNREFRRPNLYRLTYLPVGRAQPTHDWRRFKTVEQALEAIRGIRPKKQNSSHGFRQVSVMDSRTGNGQFSVMDSGLTPVMDSRTTSISRVHACERTGRRPRRPRPPPATRNTADPSTGPSG